MLTLGLFLEENGEYPKMKLKKFILLDKNDKFIRYTDFDGLDLCDRELFEMKDLPNELENNIYLIKFKISKRKYLKMTRRCNGI